MRKAIALVAFVIALAPRVHAECVTESAEAIALANQGDVLVVVSLDEALAKYEQAFKLSSTSARIARKLAAAYEKKEQWTQARGALADVVRLDPNWGEAHFELGDVMWRLGDEQGALEHLTSAVRLAPSVAAHWATLADLYRRLGFVAQASKVVVEASRFLKGDDFDFGSVAGRVHERAGEIDAAIASYESAARAPAHSSAQAGAIHFDLARVYAAAKPSRDADVKRELMTFIKAICKGALAQRYADECAQAASMLRP